MEAVTLERVLDLVSLDLHTDYVVFRDVKQGYDPLQRFVGTTVTMTVPEWTELGKPLYVSLTVTP